MIRFQFPEAEANEIYQSLSKQTHKSGSAVARFVAMLGDAIRYCGRFSDDVETSAPQDEETLVGKGVEFAKLNGRIRELQELNQAALGDIRDLRQQLKVMTEDRDEYQRKLKDSKALVCELADERSRYRADLLAAKAGNTKPDCKECSDRKYLADLFTPANNPNGYAVKYGKDHGERMLINNLVWSFVDLAKQGAESHDLCEFLDREFLFGCWREELEPRPPDLLRDLRGIIVSLAERAAETARAAQPEPDLSATDDQLFLVWRDGGSVPKMVHASHGAAKAEAERLAKANPGDRFYVLYTVGNATRLAPSVIWTCSDERFDDGAEIPF